MITCLECKGSDEHNDKYHDLFYCDICIAFYLNDFDIELNSDREVKEAHGMLRLLMSEEETRLRTAAYAGLDITSAADEGKVKKRVVTLLKEVMAADNPEHHPLKRAQDMMNVKNKYHEKFLKNINNT